MNNEIIKNSEFEDLIINNQGNTEETQINNLKTELKEKETQNNNLQNEIKDLVNKNKELIEFHEIEKLLRNKLFEKPFKTVISQSTILGKNKDKKNMYNRGIILIIHRILTKVHEFKTLLPENYQKLYKFQYLNISNYLYINQFFGTNNYIPANFFDDWGQKQDVFFYFTYNKNEKSVNTEYGQFVPIKITVVL